MTARCRRRTAVRQAAPALDDPRHRDAQPDRHVGDRVRRHTRRRSRRRSGRSHGHTALVARFDQRRLQISALVVCALVDLGLAAFPSAVTAAVAWGGTGAAFAVWSVVSVTLRQRLVRAEMLGRVNSANRVIGMTACPLERDGRRPAGARLGRGARDGPCRGHLRPAYPIRVRQLSRMITQVDFGARPALATKLTAGGRRVHEVRRPWPRCSG
ncbi:hypothetical protein [Nonomuraea endophytica]|uniref:hypothetical protein n=1 Tax=Nonomuraea endophytica TaxID=714136 RepID=UPI0037C8A978